MIFFENFPFFSKYLYFPLQKKEKRMLTDITASLTCIYCITGFSTCPFTCIYHSTRTGFPAGVITGNGTGFHFTGGFTGKPVGLITGIVTGFPAGLAAGRFYTGGFTGIKTGICTGSPAGVITGIVTGKFTGICMGISFTGVFAGKSLAGAVAGKVAGAKTGFTGRFTGVTGSTACLAGYISGLAWITCLSSASL